MRTFCRITTVNEDVPARIPEANGNQERIQVILPRANHSQPQLRLSQPSQLPQSAQPSQPSQSSQLLQYPTLSTSSS